MICKPSPKSVLSLDIGKKRIGLAGCDPLGITIKALPAIHRKKISEDIEIIKCYCKERDVKGLVIGIPLDEEGKFTSQAKYCENYGKRVAQALELPVAWVNEHSSTWEAGEIYNLKKDGTGALDSAAALLLLKQWLEEGPDLRFIEAATYKFGTMECDSRSC